MNKILRLCLNFLMLRRWPIAFNKGENGPTILTVGRLAQLFISRDAKFLIVGSLAQHFYSWAIGPIFSTDEDWPTCYQLTDRPNFSASWRWAIFTTARKLGQNFLTRWEIGPNFSLVGGGGGGGFAPLLKIKI